MDITKSTAAIGESVLCGFYVFCLSTAQAMDRLLIVFVSREEWSTATTVIKTNYKDKNSNQFG